VYYNRNVSPDYYLGVRLEELQINDVEWTIEGADHIRTRVERYGSGEFNVEPEWATQAALDPNRVAGLTAGYRLVVIGWSASAPGPEGRGRLLKVWIYPKDLTTGSWLGVSACAANEKDRKAYEG
jgi:hypothetical protein